MKKLYFLGMAGLVAISLAGCNRAWPGCFGRGLLWTPAVYDACDPCCETEVEGSYYVEPDSEWVPATAPTIVEPLPTPAPITEAPKSSTSSSQPKN